MMRGIFLCAFLLFFASLQAQTIKAQQKAFIFYDIFKRIANDFRIDTGELTLVKGFVEFEQQTIFLYRGTNGTYLKMGGEENGSSELNIFKDSLANLYKNSEYQISLSQERKTQNRNTVITTDTFFNSAHFGYKNKKMYFEFGQPIQGWNLIDIYILINEYKKVNLNFENLLKYYNKEILVPVYYMVQKGQIVYQNTSIFKYSIENREGNLTISFLSSINL